MLNPIQLTAIKQEIVDACIAEVRVVAAHEAVVAVFSAPHFAIFSSLAVIITAFVYFQPPRCHADSREAALAVAAANIASLI